MNGPTGCPAQLMKERLIVRHIPVKLWNTRDKMKILRTPGFNGDRDRVEGSSHMPRNWNQNR